ncbi:hypothetical protein RV420_290399 [Roseovarius sp. EC-SD190]|nr:hypothetical protein RV420_290399 [Roseovarius sp. EC-SD190]
MHFRHAGQPGQVLAVDTREILGILCDDLEDIVGSAGGEVTFQHIGHPRHRLFKGVEHLVCLRGKRNLDKNRGGHAHFTRVKQSDIALDIPIGFKALNAAVTGRGGEIDLFCEVGVGNAPAPLKDMQQATICRIEGHLRKTFPTNHIISEGYSQNPVKGERNFNLLARVLLQTPRKITQGGV